MMSDMCESSYNQFDSFPALDILGEDFCPQFDIHDDTYFSANQLTTESSHNSDALEVDLQEELDKMLKSEGSESIFNIKSKEADYNNNNHVNSENKFDIDLAVKEELDSSEQILTDDWKSMSGNVILSQLNQYLQENPSTHLKEEDCEDILPVKVEQDQPSINIPKPTIGYIRHIQPMPERTSPLPNLMLLKKMFRQTNQHLLPTFPTVSLKEKEVTYLGRTIAPLNHLMKSGPGSQVLRLQTPRGKLQGKTRSLLGFNPPQLQAHSLNPILGSANTSLPSPEIMSNSQYFDMFSFPREASAKVILVRNSSDRAPKFRKGISVLKPVFPANSPVLEDAPEPKLNITAAEVAHKHTKAGQNARKQLQEKKMMFRETKKITILGRFIPWPRVESPVRVTSTSGWVTKEDPLKDKKNQQERDRRGELAKYREKLRVLLPPTKEIEKVATVTVLETARDYCAFLQHQVDQLETEFQKEEQRNVLLKWRLTRLETDTTCLPNVEAPITEEIAIDKFFGSFEF